MTPKRDLSAYISNSDEFFVVGQDSTGTELNTDIDFFKVSQDSNGVLNFGGQPLLIPTMVDSFC